MTQKAYCVICATIFLVVAVAHLSRLITGWDVSLAGWTVPHWVSIPGLIVPGLLSAWGFTMASRPRRS